MAKSMHFLKGRKIVKHCFGCNPEDIAKKVIFIRGERLSHFSSLLTQKKSFSGFWQGVTGFYKGTRVSIICSGRYASCAGDSVLALAGTPCEAIYGEGTFGAINKDIRIGDFAFIKKAIVGEGFTKYLFPYNKVSYSGKISKEVLAYLEAYCGKLKVRFHKGIIIFTTESFLAETKNFVKNLEEIGADGVEMEASAFFSAAKAIKARAVFLVWCSDEPKRKSYYHKEYSKYSNLKRTNYLAIPKLLLEVVVNDYKN